MRQNTAVFEKILAKLLLHGALTRKQTAGGFGISHVAAAAYMNALLAHRLVKSEKVRAPHVKRPVESFRVNGEVALSLALSIGPRQVSCELVRADATTLADCELRVERPSQLALTDALRSAMAWAHAADTGGVRVSLVGLSVQGYLEPTSGMIFHVPGIADWEPCHLGELVLELGDLETLAWSAAACKLMGFSRRQQRDDGIGFVEFHDVGRRLAVATMQNGVLQLGRFGTPGRDMHQPISREGERCICGRKGCFAWHLRHGLCTPEMLRTAISRIILGLGVSRVGLEWAGAAAEVPGWLPEGEQDIEVVPPEQAEHLRRDGLRSACSFALLRQTVEHLCLRQPSKTINHNAFRGTQTVNGDSHPMVAAI